MLLAGTKPLRYVNPNIEPPEIDRERKLIVEIYSFGGGRRYLIFKIEQAWRANAWHRTDNMHAAGKISTRTAHARRGLLLGYPKDAIRKFLHRNEPLR